jgi:hypothetical protein
MQMLVWLGKNRAVEGYAIFEKSTDKTPIAKRMAACHIAFPTSVLSTTMYATDGSDYTLPGHVLDADAFMRITRFIQYAEKELDKAERLLQQMIRECEIPRDIADKVAMLDGKIRITSVAYNHRVTFSEQEQAVVKTVLDARFDTAK